MTIGFAGVAAGIASVLAYDRKITTDYRRGLREEASARYGSQRVPEGGPSKVTVFATAANAIDLRAIRKTWNILAADILTAAGVDYCLVETDLGEKDRLLHESRVVPDGMMVPTEVPAVVTAECWLLPTVSEWMGTGMRLDDEEFSAFWARSHSAKPKGFDPKLVLCLDPQSNAAVSKAGAGDTNPTLIECAPSDTLMMRLIDRILDYPRARLVGSAVMQFLARIDHD